MPIRYEQWPPRQIGGQHVGTGPSGVRGVHSLDGIETGIEAACCWHRSQHRNRTAVRDMIAYALADAGISEEVT